MSNPKSVKSGTGLFVVLSPISLLLGVIQPSNKIIMDDKQPIFGQQSVSLPNFFVAENIVHYLPNFIATWNPPFWHQQRDIGAVLEDDERSYFTFCRQGKCFFLVKSTVQGSDKLNHAKSITAD